MNAVIYIHGKGGNAAEAEHYKNLFRDCDVIGIDYQSSLPWEAGKEIHNFVKEMQSEYDRIILIANSIGAFFAMNADIEKDIFHAYFISPVTDMEKLITGMMAAAGVTETQLQAKGIIHTEFGEELSWEYLCFVREHPVKWTVPTDILYGSEDKLISFDSITAFAQACKSNLTVMNGGEHWFHTPEQMQFLDDWIKNNTVKGEI